MSSGKMLFKVITPLSVRTQPSLSGARLTNAQLAPGTTIEVDAGSRQQVDGFIWWKHSMGWSAEKTLEGSKVFMEFVEDVPQAPVTPPAPVDVTPSKPAETAKPATPAAETAEKPAVTLTPGKRIYAVQDTLSVRAQPGLNAPRLGQTLTKGDLIEVDTDNRQEVDGFVWWRHSAGWSAERKLDNSIIYLLEASAEQIASKPVVIPTTNPDGTLNLDALPQRGALFARLPLDLDQVKWVQYFGNTIFAFENGRRWSYHTFAQGLHSGLDLGNNKPGGIPIFAGVEGKILRNDRFGIAISSGEYVIIYQHLHKLPPLEKNTPITPNTVLGEMDAQNNHLHLEVRFSKEKWIINPLLVIPDALRDGIINKFPTFSRHFYKSEKWTLWQSPLDQPVIVRGGPLVGPTAS